MVNKITTPPTTSELIGTVNEIIDDIPTVDQTFDRNSTNAQSGVAVGQAQNELGQTVIAALSQIDEKKYDSILINRGIDSSRIRKYGFAFEGKKVLIGKSNGE